MASRQPQLRLGDRVISAIMAGTLGFGTMLVVWLIVLYLGGRDEEDVSLPFYSNWIVAGLAAGAGFIVGPERMLDGFGAVWRVIGALSFGSTDDRTPPAPRKRKTR